MSFLKETIPVAIPVLIGLGFTLGIHHYSQAETTRRMQQIAEKKTLQEQAQSERQAALGEMLNASVEAATARNKKIAAREQEVQKAATIAALPGDPAKGRGTYMTCMACHGMKAEGQRMFNSPRLAHQEPWYIKRQLVKFKEGVRGAHPQDVYGMQMAPIAKLLFNEEVVDNVVAYLATLDPGKKADRGKGDAAKGKESYALCATCHGKKAEGNTVQKAPKLTGQHAWYLAKQLKNFKDGIRGAHAQDSEGQLMAPIAKTLQDDAAIDDLIAYIQSLNEE